MPESKRRKPKAPVATRPTKPAQAEIAAKGPSPRWYVWTMFGLLGAGVILVIIPLIFSLDRVYTLTGLVMIGLGFFMTTNYR